MKFTHFVKGMIMCGLTCLGLAAQADVVFNESKVTGTIRIGNEPIRSVVMIARSGSLESRQTFYPGSDATTINYILPVNVPAGESLRYRVYAYALYLAGSGNRVDFYSHYIDIADGVTVNADFIIDNPGYIEGDVIVNGAELNSATLRFSGNRIHYRAAAPRATSNHYRVAVEAGRNTLSPSSELILKDGRRIKNIPSQTVEVVAGETTNFDVVYDAPPLTLIQANVNMTGPITAIRHSCQLLGAGVNYSKGAPCEYSVAPGHYILRARSNFNKNDDRFIHPYASYASGTDRRDVVAGETEIFNINSEQAFIDGQLTFSGAATNTDLNWGWITAQGISPQSLGGESQDYDIADGIFDLIVSPGEWNIWLLSTGFFRDNPSNYLNSYIHYLRLGNEYKRLTTVEAGMTSNVPDIDIELGGVTVNFHAENAVTFSKPFLLGSCFERDDAGNVLYSYQPSAQNQTIEGVSDGQVSFVGLAAECNLRAYATVNGARVVFGVFAVTVDPGVTKTVDLGAPELNVEFPDPNLITSNSSIAITGKATDDVGVAQITINGVSATLQSTNNSNDVNEVSFVVPTQLARGPNSIATIATDEAGKQATDTRIVYRDEALPEVSFNPNDGAITTEFSVLVEGIANDDAGVESVNVNGVAVSLISTGNSNAPNEVSFSSSQTLVLGDNLISVTVTDISHRTRTIVHKITVVENRPPVANSGADMQLSCASVTSTDVSLNGDASYDVDGDALTYNWLGDFVNITGIAPTVTMPIGSHDITLTVYDGLASDSDSITVNVNVDVNGLLPPFATLVEMGSEPEMPKNAFKHGRVIPLKLELSCAGTALNDVDVAAPAIMSITPQGVTPVDLTVIDPDAGMANDNGLLFRFSDSAWVYNLKTTDLMPGTVYDISIKTPDGQTLISRFALK